MAMDSVLMDKVFTKEVALTSVMEVDSVVLVKAGTVDLLDEPKEQHKQLQDKKIKKTWQIKPWTFHSFFFVFSFQ